MSEYQQKKLTSTKVSKENSPKLMIGHYPKAPESCVLSFISPRLKYPISDTGTVH